MYTSLLLTIISRQEVLTIRLEFLSQTIVGHMESATTVSLTNINKLQLQKVSY